MNSDRIWLRQFPSGSNVNDALYNGVAVIVNKGKWGGLVGDCKSKLVIVDLSKMVMMQND